MATVNTGREGVRTARERLDEWTVTARDRAYGEQFEGPDAVLTAEELATLDRIDSALTRRGGVGVWGADEYGIVLNGLVEAETPRVVCTYHPTIPYERFGDAERLDESTRAEFNDVLWDYGERVAELVQEELDAFLRSAPSRAE